MKSSRTTKSSHKTQKDDAGRMDGTVYVNAYETAQNLVQQGVVIDDDRLRNEDGTLVPPVTGTWWEKRMAALRTSAHAGVWTLPGPEITDIDLTEVAKAQAEAEELDVRNGRVLDDRHDHAAVLKENLLDLERHVPDRVLPEQYAKLNLPSKLVFWAGDLSVIASPLYLSGVPLPLAMLQGAAVALTAVMVGSVLGADGGAHLRRVRRGPVPESLGDGFVDLFKPREEDQEDPLRLLLVGAAGVTFALFTAIVLVIMGEGEPFMHGAGAGLMTGLTVWGSAATQHFTSNSAASLVKATTAQLDRTHEIILDLEASGVSAAGAAAEYGELRALVEAAADAADAGVEALDPRVDTPRVNGYDAVAAQDGAATVAAARPTAPTGPAAPTELAPLLRRYAAADGPNHKGGGA